MKNLSLTIVAILYLNLTYSQNYDFGKVSKEELQEKYYPTDSSASAAILYRSENISFTFSQNDGFTQQKEIEMRIKIYDKEGFDWANKKVYLYKGDRGNNERIKGLKGTTYNIENGKVSKDKLKNDGIFKEEASEFYEVTSFTLPNVKAGSVLEYKYTISSPLVRLDDIELQYGIPIKKIDVEVSTPQFYRYNVRLNPKAFYLPSYTTTKRDKILTTTRKVENGSYVGSGVSRSKSETRYFENVVTLTEENIPSLKAESYSGNINNYKAKISLEYEARLNLDGIVEKSFASSWDGVAKNIYESNSFGGQMEKFSFYKDDLNTITQGIDDDFQKAFLVERLVKSKVKWNGNYGKYAQKGIRSAYKDGEGNVADINLMVTSMLRSLGVNANPVLISTRNNGVPLFPTREGFNYVICVVQSGDSYLLIDATERFSGNNVLPERVLNWQGRVISDNGTSRWINIKPNKKSTESTMLNVSLKDDFSANGKVRKSYSSYLAMSYRDKYTSLSKDDHIKSIESNKDGIEISELSFENDKDLSKPVKITYDYELSDGIDEVGDKLYFSPLLFLATKENPFKLEERIYPIDFVLPYQDKFLVNIMLPEGYKAESLPKSEAMAFKDGDAKFEYILEENDKFLQLKMKLEVNNPLVQPNDYKDFKAFFGKIVEKQAEQIVLTKA